MAIIKNGFTRGKISNVIYSVRNGVQNAKGVSQKKKYNKTKGTIDSSTVFGKASTLGLYIRMSMYDAFNDFHDSGMSTRLTGRIVESFKPILDEAKLYPIFTQTSFKRLEGFEFNINSPIQNFLFAELMVDYSANNLVKVTIPEMKSPKEFVFPENMRKCKFVVSCGLLDLENGFLKETESQLFDIQQELPTMTIPAHEFTFPTEPGCLCLIAVSLQFYKTTFAGNIIINNKQFNPSAILSAYITDGTVTIGERTYWDKMTFMVKRSTMSLTQPSAQLILGSPEIKI
jgi:hypothetical protein